MSRLIINYLAVFLIGCLVITSVSIGSTAKQKYLYADSCYIKLRQSSAKLKKASEWLKCIKQYENIYKSFPSSPWAPAGMYKASQLYVTLSKLSDRKSYAAQAADLLTRLRNKYPESAYSKRAKTLLKSIHVAPTPIKKNVYSGTVFGGEFEGRLKKAEQGNAIAQSNLGYMYSTGQGVTQDYKQAVYWYKKAAEQGNADAQLNLGSIYFFDVGGAPQDYKQSFYWYKKAAEQNDIFAHTVISLMYYLGRGTLQNLEQFIYWGTQAKKKSTGREGWTAVENPEERAAAAPVTNTDDWVEVENPEEWTAVESEPTGREGWITVEDIEEWTAVESEPTGREGWITVEDIEEWTPVETKPTGREGWSLAENQDGWVSDEPEAASQGHKQAFSWLKKSAKNDDAFAQTIIGVMYGAGEVIPENDKLCKFWLKKAAEQGFSLAQAFLGLLYAKEKEILQERNLAEFWLKKAAEQGDTLSYFFLGSMYYSGQGVPKNHKQSFYWYEKAAKQGFSVAQYELGEMYYYGQGVPKNYKQSFYWYEKAAEQGNDDAQYELGKMNYSGQGVPKNYMKAVSWFKKSAEQGNIYAQIDLGEMYYSGEDISQDYKQALYWLKKGAEQGYIGPTYAWAMLVDMYSNGKGTPQDYKEAEYWVKQAALRGYTPNSLGEMYSNGEQIPQDYKQAVYWYSKAAEQGIAYAQFNLSIMYYEGKGTTQNYKLAYVWESLAASQGFKNAAENRDITAKQLTPYQLSQAQELAAKIQYKIDNPRKPQEQNSSKVNTAKKFIGSGTGFIITKDGYVLTCYHVIKDANEIKISKGGNLYSAKLIRKDSNNDLALLKINGSFQAIAFSPNRSAKMGQEVFTIGYPNPSLQGVSAKFTKGTINSLTGFQDDLRLYQVSVPVQPGNSGGALVDEKGNILGVIVAMLSAKTAFKISGSLPQNVNYAVKSMYAQAILDTLPKISNKLLNPSKRKSNAVERVKASTVMVLSYE